MANPAGSFIWYELMSPDPDASKTFYDAVVGWTIGAQQPGEPDYRMIVRSDGGNAGGVMRLTEEMAQHGAVPCWLGYLDTPDVDAAAAAITADGGKVLMAANDLPVGRIAMVADAQGAPFYIMKPTPPAGAEDATSDVFSVDQPQHVRWNELATTDPEAATVFYCKHFGWSQEREMDMGPMGAYRFIDHGGVGIGAIMGSFPDAAGKRGSLWTFFIGVDEIDRAIAAVSSGGGKIVNGPHQIPGGEFTVHAIDPQGATVGLVGPRSS